MKTERGRLRETEGVGWGGSKKTRKREVEKMKRERRLKVKKRPHEDMLLAMVFSLCVSDLPLHVDFEVNCIMFFYVDHSNL